MKHFIIALPLLFFSKLSLGKSSFFPEKGSYDFRAEEVSEYLKQNGVDYVAQRGKVSLPFKLDKKTNEFQIKDWFLQDWNKLQDLFSFDLEAFIASQKAETFNEAKRAQFSSFVFSKKSLAHKKTLPVMKEWGGLSHPPLKSLDFPLERYDSNFRKIDYRTIESPFFDPTLHHKLDELSDSELTFGNVVTPFADRESFERKKEIIRRAKHSIFLSSLAFVCDSSTREIVDLLIEKKRSGVKIFVLADGFLSKALGFKECPLLMKKSGIQVILTKDFFKHKGKSLYHTKVLVADLAEAIAGGQNMIDADHRSHGTDFKNRDVDLYFKGPIVLDIARGFIENWEYQRTFVKDVPSLDQAKTRVFQRMNDERVQGLRGKEHYDSLLKNPSTRMGGVCRFINQAPYKNGSVITNVYLEILDKTTNHLVITDPIKSDTVYSHPLRIPLIDKFDSFTNFNLLHQKVLGLSDRRVKIDYITTNIRMAGNENVAIQSEKIKGYLEQGREFKANLSFLNLSLSNRYFGKPHYKNLLKDWYPQSNVHVWNHISLMHSKIFYFDRVLSSVGSFNFHHNATDHAYESTAVCLDEDLNRGLDRILVLDMANSIPLIFSKVQ